MKKIIWLVIAMFMLGGCAPKPFIYVTLPPEGYGGYAIYLPDPYQGLQERQMKIQALEYQRQQAEAQR